MVFDLSLNLEIKAELEPDCSVSQPLDKLSRQVRLSPESLLVASVIKYCGVFAREEIRCVCYYSKRDLLKKVGSLESDFEDTLEACLGQFLKKLYDEIFKLFDILLCDMDELNKDFFQTTLPWLKRKFSEHCFITITGLASLFRDLIKTAIKIKPGFDLERLLGYRNNCLNACSEVSKWTYLCEIMSVKVCQTINDTDSDSVELRREFFEKIDETLREPLQLASRNKRSILNRKHISINDEDNNKRFLQDYFITLSDLMLFYFVTKILNESDETKKLVTEEYKSICAWYNEIKKDSRITEAFLINMKPAEFENIYKFENLKISDSSTESNCIKQIKNNLEKNNEFNIELIIENLKQSVERDFQIQVPLPRGQIFSYTYEDISINWSDLNAQVNPTAGGLPDKRIDRKCQQLENFLYVFKNQIFEKRKSQIDVKMTVVDFCSGGGHLGILIAYLFPECDVKLVENKETSIENAIKRIQKLELQNVSIFKGNLNNFIGSFNVGIAIHACGSATDLLIEKCVANKADILIAPCCYGSIKENDLIKYPRSAIFRQAIENDVYQVLSSYADRTEEDTAYLEKGNLCMSIIDTDRLLYIKEMGYQFYQLDKLKPESCSAKNSLIYAFYL